MTATTPHPIRIPPLKASLYRITACHGVAVALAHVTAEVTIKAGRTNRPAIVSGRFISKTVFFIYQVNLGIPRTAAAAAASTKGIIYFRKARSTVAMQ